MARLANEDIATVLADIANVLIDDEKNRLPQALLKVRIGLIIADWLEDRPESLSDLYDSKLHIPA